MARTIARLLVLGLCLSTAHAAAQQATVLNRVVAVVDGEAILLSDLERTEALFARIDPRNARRAALDHLIGRALLAQLAEREPPVPDADVDRAIENVRRQAGLSDSAFWAAVAQPGFTRSRYRSDVRRELGMLRAVDRRVPPNLARERLHEERERIRRELIRELRAHAQIDIRI